jgi:hypothetical protein
MWQSNECPLGECCAATNAEGECGEATNAEGECGEATNAEGECGRATNVQARMQRSCECPSGECLRLMCKNVSYAAEKCLKSLDGNAF